MASGNMMEDFQRYFGGDVLRRFNREQLSQYGDGLRLDYQGFQRAASERMMQAQSPEEALAWLHALVNYEYYGEWDEWQADQAIADELQNGDPDPALVQEANAMWERFITDSGDGSAQGLADARDTMTSKKRVDAARARVARRMGLTPPDRG